MFRKTDTTPQMDLFSDATLHFTERAYLAFTDNRTWFSQYFHTVTSRIREDIFAPLYSDTGACNMSSRLIISIMILKKALGLNETVMLGEKCLFDLAVRKSLGLASLLDEIPAATTVHSFLSRVQEYKEENGKDLIQECMNELCGKRKLHFLIDGKNITIDSRFLQEKPVKSPYETIHREIVLALRQKELQKALPAKLLANVNTIIKENAKESMTKAQQKARLRNIGVTLAAVLKKVKTSNPAYERLYNTVNAHFSLKQGTLMPKIR